MNILEVEDMIKGLPDQALQQEAQAPTGQVPQFLVVSEIQRRTDMRKRYQQQQQQQPQGTVADQIIQEGIAGLAPQMGMPPQAMPQQGMPPQQMFGGGIIRLQEGGSTSMPGAGALESIMYAIQEKAKDIARITGRKFEEVYETLLRQAQEQNPDYSMIAPAGLGDMPSVDLEPIQRAAQETPIGDLFSNIANEAFDARDYGVVPAYAAGLREGITGALPAFGKTAYQGLKELGSAALGVVPDEVPELVAMPFTELGKGVGTLVTGDPSSDPLGSFGRSLGSSMYDAGEVATVRPSEDTGIDPARSDLPELSEAIVTAQQLSPDASRKDVGTLYEEDSIETLLRKGGPKEVQGTSRRQAQAIPDPGKPDALDFSDLIKESKDAAMANALMQLGAGIAGGDVSKGISAAGMAAAKGQQDAKAIAMRQRLAEYQAGREDLARAEKADQFDRQMTALETRYANELVKAASVGRNELFRTVTSLVEAAMEGSSEFDPAKREAMVQAMMKKYLSAYAPAFDVDPETVSFGMKEDQGSIQPQEGWGIAGR